MYSASAKGCNQPGCRVQTIVNSRYQDFPPVPRRRHSFPPCPECDPWISRHLEVATMPYPRSSRREQDGCPSSAHPHPSPPPLPTAPLKPPPPPTHLPQDQWSSQPVDPSDKAEGKEGGGWPTARRRGEEGEQHQSRRGASPEKDLIGSRRENSC